MMAAVTRRSIVSPSSGARVSIDPYALNPLADDYRQVNDATFTLASRKAGPPPKLFANGTADLPAVTASGVDPKVLLQVPFAARHALAAEPNPAIVHAMLERDASNPDFELPHEGLTAALGRMRDWASGRMDRDRNDTSYDATT